MSPRPYQLGKRQGQIDASRRRVVDAAGALLAESTTYTAFTVDAVARRADVARATVYYQFGSKTGLLEALCDALAEAGQMSELAEVFTNPSPADLAGFVDRFSRLWSVDRLVMRRLRALAALDPEVEAVIATLDEWRRAGLRLIVARLAEHSGGAMTADPEEAVRVLHAITSFETFDALAGPDRRLSDVAPLVLHLAKAALQPTG